MTGLACQTDENAIRETENPFSLSMLYFCAKKLSCFCDGLQKLLKINLLIDAKF